MPDLPTLVRRFTGSSVFSRRVRGAGETLAWLKRSAEGGFPRAANEFGQALVEGDKREEGQRWLEVAARAGEPEALYNLGLLKVKGSDSNETAAVGLFLEACERGLSAACKNVGVAYYNGKGVGKKDLRLARLWFEKAGDAHSRSIAAMISESLGAVKEEGEL